LRRFRKFDDKPVLLYKKIAEQSRGQGGVMHTPIYREAYPAFDVNRATAAGQKGRELCVFSNERGLRLGVAFVTRPEGASSLVLEHTIGGPYLSYSDQGIRVRVEPLPNQLNDARLAVLCPMCHRRRSILVYKDHWACAKCHKLLYRSQVVDKLTLKWERKEWLTAKIGKGRPLGMHNKKYVPLRQELDLLQEQFAGKLPRYASAEHSYRISSEWRPADDPFADLGGYTRYGLINGSLQVLPEGYWSEQGSRQATPSPSRVRTSMKMDPGAILFGDGERLGD
jgi:ribosomal protein L37AE/L43A